MRNIVITLTAAAPESMCGVEGPDGDLIAGVFERPEIKALLAEAGIDVFGAVWEDDAEAAKHSHPDL